MKQSSKKLYIFIRATTEILQTTPLQTNAGRCMIETALEDSARVGLSEMYVKIQTTRFRLIFHKGVLQKRLSVLVDLKELSVCRFGK